MNHKIAKEIRAIDEEQTRLTQLVEGFDDEQLRYMTDLVYEANAANDNDMVRTKVRMGDPQTLVDVLSKYSLLIYLAHEWLRRYGEEQ